ncbi:MAG: aspartate/glutamate racemase family protein [Microbacteriaceae bacterium]
MRVRALTAVVVDNDELDRRQARYTRLAPQGWEIVVESFPCGPDHPTEMSTEHDIRRSEEIGAELAYATDSTLFDAVLSDCVLDPAIATIERNTDLTVLGITRLSVNFLASCGLRFGVVTRNDVIGEEYAKVVESLGAAHLFDGFFALGLPVSEVSNTEVWNRAIGVAAQRAEERGVTILINGCSAADLTWSSRTIQVIDPTALALKVAALARDVGLLR